MRRLTLRTGEPHRGRRLDEVVGEWLAHALGQSISRSAVRCLLMAGAVQVDGRPARRPGWPVVPGVALHAEVRVEDLDRAVPRRSDPPLLTTRQILYEDDLLIVLDKPPGLPTVATADPRREHLVGMVKRFLAARVVPDARIPKGEPYLGVHQRLDRDTSGIVLFSKHAAANRSLADSFARGRVRKTYRALTRRPRKLPPPSWTVETRLGTVGKGRVASVTTGGVLAQTELARLQVFPAGLLVEARPLTGRKHQIRVHLAEGGLPILGDTAYGGGGPADRAMLHAARLVFPHPRSGQDVVIECPDPPDFAAVLETLRGNRRRHRPPGQTHRFPGRAQRH